MAVCFPLFLLLYEIIFHTSGLRNPRAWLTRDCVTVGVTGLITLVYIVGKLTGADSLVENPAYALTISPVRFLHTFHLYLNPLLYQDHWFRDANTVQFLIAMLVFAVWRRSRVLLFAWFWLLLTTLPISFIAHYAAFFEYLPFAGWTLYTATVLVMLRRAIVRFLPETFPLSLTSARASQVFLSLILAAFLAPLHARESAKTLKHYMSVQPPSREIISGLAGLQPVLRRGARILFVNDPFPADSYFLLFTARLLYRDMTIQVDRKQIQSVAESNYAHYDAVFGFRDGRVVKLSEPLR
jgi:hypothetical protein